MCRCNFSNLSPAVEAIGVSPVQLVEKRKSDEFSISADERKIDWIFFNGEVCFTSSMTKTSLASSTNIGTSFVNTLVSWYMWRFYQSKSVPSLTGIFRTYIIIGEKVSAWMSTIHSTRPEERFLLFQQNCWRKICLPFINLGLWGKGFRFVEKNTVVTAFSVSRKIFCRRKRFLNEVELYVFFSEFERNVPIFLTEQFRLVCQNCILRFRRTLREKKTQSMFLCFGTCFMNLSAKKTHSFVIDFEVWAKTSQIFVEKFSAGS